MGAFTVCEATLHFPPATSSVPAQRKARRRFVDVSESLGGEAEAMEMWTGMAERVTLVSVARPASLRSPAFQVGILAATLSINGCSSARRGFSRVSGIPRYLHGKGASRPGKATNRRDRALVHVHDKARGIGEELEDGPYTPQIPRRG